ncbi:hypothetical protein N656DRAFT_513618 [Canariomyces notabilis]|uniref:Uncharacterized protein n=1 Tax=Canariomyces notabilis TaxID=2074819 RepID=A0AAN6QC45_9PEZI|nr:hypothetical protein N656DRAFT_513618 [Canariomyces arenarius]
MVSVCAGLVTVDGNSGIIRLVHYTTQEYFERTRGRWLPDAESYITKVCVTYLSFMSFRQIRLGCLTAEDFLFRREALGGNWNTLDVYVTLNWGHHAREISTICDEVMQFLRDKSAVRAASDLMAFTLWETVVRRWVTGDLPPNKGVFDDAARLFLDLTPLSLNC